MNEEGPQERISSRFTARPAADAAAAIPVRRGTDNRTGKPCRMYMVPNSLPGLDRGALEARASALLKLRHPSLENLLGLVESGLGPGGSVFWVYEAAEGRSFEELAGDGRPFSEPEAAGIAAALAGVLKKIHGEPFGQSCGAIAPRNIFLTEGGRPVLSAIKPFEAASPEDLEYLPPGEEPSAGGDIYALGASLVFLFSRRRPSEFRAEGGFRDLGRHTGFSKEFCRILEKMTAEPAGDRYDRAGRLEKDLGALLTGGRPSLPARLFRSALLLAFAALGGAGALSYLSRGAELVSLKGGGVEWAMPGGLAFSPDGKLLALAGDAELYLWETDGWRRRPSGIPKNKPGVHTRSVAFLRDGAFAVGSASGEGVSEVRFVPAPGGRGWAGSLGSVLDSIAASPDGGLFAVAENSYDRAEQQAVGGRLTVYGADGRLAHAPGPPGGPVHSVNFSPDGKSLVYRTYHWDEPAKAYSLGRVASRELGAAAEDVLCRDAGPGVVSRLFSYGPRGLMVVPEAGSEALNAYGPGGRLLARINEDSLLEEYVYTTSAEGAFSPDGRFFAAEVTKKNRLYLRVFSTESWKVLKEFKLGKWKDGGVAAIAFSPDGSTLAAAQGDAFRSRVRVFKAEWPAAGVK